MLVFICHHVTLSLLGFSGSLFLAGCASTFCDYGPNLAGCASSKKFVALVDHALFWCITSSGRGLNFSLLMFGANRLQNGPSRLGCFFYCGLRTCSNALWPCSLWQAVMGPFEVYLGALVMVLYFTYSACYASGAHFLMAGFGSLNWVFKYPNDMVSSSITLGVFLFQVLGRVWPVFLLSVFMLSFPWKVGWTGFVLAFLYSW